MKKGFDQGNIHIFVFVLMLIGATGCFVEDKAITTDDSSSSSSSSSSSVVVSSTPTPASTFTISGVGSKSDVSINYHTHRVGPTINSNTECSISSTAMANESITSTTTEQDITCFVEAKELDLFRNGLKFQINVDSGVCEFVSVRPYWFWQFPPGVTGNWRSSNTETSTVIISATHTASYMTHELGSCELCDNGPCPSSTAAPSCTYDYSGLSINENPGNCDQGTKLEYIMKWDDLASATTTHCYTATSLNADNGGEPYIQDATACGGSFYNCAVGPGKDYLNVSGIPVGGLIAAHNGLTNEEINSFKVPIEVLYEGNIYLANYTTACRANDSTYNTTSFYNFANTDRGYPTSTSSDFDSRQNGAQPAYEFRCLSGSYEVKARISVFAREWDSAFSTTLHTSQLVAMTSSLMDGGTTTNFIGRVNDYPDWDQTDNEFIWGSSETSTFTIREDSVHEGGVLDCTVPSSSGFTPPGVLL